MLRRASPHLERGAALIEALVALLVLSVGLLGMVGLQTASVRYEQSSWARSAVATQISDIADRIRANPGATDTAYLRTQSFEDERTEINTDSSTFNVNPDCASANCTPAELAAYDMAKWRSAINASIPQAVGFVSGSRATAYSVTIAWLDKNRIDSAGALESAPTCTASMKGADARNCCPDDLEAPAGVRCVNFSVIP
jgi:type IV pilus assembly protein PilV